MNSYTDIYKENDNTYINISFTSNSTNAIFPLEYNVTKTLPIIEDASKYYVTVTKFDIPLSGIPLIIMPIIPNQNNPNLSPLIIGISIGSVYTLENVIYISQENIEPNNPPIQNDPNKQVITPYYYMFSYNQMIMLINNALRLAYTTAGLINTPPYFIYNSETGLISLIVGSEFNTNTGLTPTIVINFEMFNFLEAFDVTALPPFLNTNSLYFFNIYGLVNESFGYATFGNDPVDPPLFYKITQDYSTIYTWSPIRKILFLSSTLPIHYEIVPSTNINTDNTGVYNSLAIITDFTPIIEKPGDSRSIAYYTTNGYGGIKLTDMTTNTPIYKISIRVLWQDKSNNIYPLEITSFEQANIKLGFIRKSLYKNI